MTAVAPFETAQDATTFIKGGRAMFTLKSLASGTHYTYKVQQKKDKENLMLLRVKRHRRVQRHVLCQRVGRQRQH